MSPGQSRFEMTAIIAVVALLSAWGASLVKEIQPLGYEDTRRKAAAVAGDFERAGARYVRDLTIGVGVERAQAAIETPPPVLARPTDPLRELRKSL